MSSKMVAFVPKPDIAQKLKALAEKEKRSVSNVVTLIVMGFFEGETYIKLTDGDLIQEEA